MMILFINLPYFGHVVPTIGLVQELINHGCNVTYLMPFDWQEKIASSGAEFAGYQNHSKLSVQMKNAYEAAEKIIKDYDLIIYEQFFFLGKHLAEKYNKKVVRIFTSPAINETLMKEYIQTGPLKVFRHKWIAKHWTKKVANGISLKTDCWLDEIVHNPPELNLVYTLEEFQPYVEEFPKNQYKFLGTSIDERKDEYFFKSLKKPIIYISLGTVIQCAVSFFRQCIDAFSKEDVTVIMSVGKDFKIGKLGTIPSNFHVFHSVPQNFVLKKSNLFITHGGMNSISEAILHGVPMVVVPLIADQPSNARRLVDLGLGICLNYKTLDSKVLKTAALSVMNDITVLGNINHMKETMLHCLGNKGGVQCIMDYVNERNENINKSIDEKINENTKRKN